MNKKRQGGREGGTKEGRKEGREEGRKEFNCRCLLRAAHTSEYISSFPAGKAAIVLRGANYTKKLTFLVGYNKCSSLQNFTSVCQRPTTVWG